MKFYLLKSTYWYWHLDLKCGTNNFVVSPFGRKPDLRWQNNQLNKSLGFIHQISHEIIYQNLIHNNMTPKAHYAAFCFTFWGVPYFLYFFFVFS